MDNIVGFAIAIQAITIKDVEAKTDYDKYQQRTVYTQEKFGTISLKGIIDAFNEEVS